MCPCEPISSDNVSELPSGLGDLAPQLPSFDIPFPELPVEDLINLFNTLNMILPPGTLRPNLSPQYSKNVLDAILSLLESFLPFLMMYTFFMPILNMILCIIEVLCALMNPFKLIRALRRLFRTCIPEFLALFPFFALIIMILSLLLLILSLILYLIERIIAMIKQIIANIELLADAIDKANSDSVIAITTKLGDLLCILQNLFVILGVIVLLFQVIEQLLNLFFKIPPCDDDDSGEDGCCTPEVCPAFIKNNREISGTGTIIYYNDVKASGEVLRVASLQIYDATALPATEFGNIIEPVDLAEPTSFFPTQTYTATTPPTLAPYTIDVRFFYDPSDYLRADARGARYLRVKNCIVLSVTKSTLGSLNGLGAPFNGTLLVKGGTAYEDDGVTVASTSPSTIDTLISFPPSSGVGFTIPDNGRGKDYSITYTLKINHNILFATALITSSCHPDLAFDKNFINNTIAGPYNAKGTALRRTVLPDAQKVQDDITRAVTIFRNNVSTDTARTLQNTVVGILQDMQAVTEQAAKDVIDIGVDPFKSTFELDPSIQFVNQPINILVTLNESGSKNVATNLPAGIGSSIAANVASNITLGAASPFTYDGSGQFVAQINSDVPGNGHAQVSYLSQLISVLSNPTDINDAPTVTPLDLLYTFVHHLPSAGTGTGTGGGGSGPGEDGGTGTGTDDGTDTGTGTGGSGATLPGGIEGNVRRDETDVSREGSDNNGE